MAGSKMVPELRFREFGKEWLSHYLKEFLEFQNGFNSGGDVYGSGTALISVMDILNNNFITYDAIRGKANVSAEDKKRYAVEYGDVLFQRSSENFEDAGRSNVYLDAERNAIFGGFVIRGKKISEYDPIFMRYALDASVIRTQITSKAQGAQHINVSQDTLQDVLIRLPKLDEQVNIGKLLYNVDSLIDYFKNRYDKMLTLKVSMLKKMFPKAGSDVPEIRFAGFTVPWEQRKLRDMGTTFSGLSGKTKEDFGHGNARFVTYMNVFLNPISDPRRIEAVEIDRSQNIVQYGDVFFTTSSETPEEVGMTSVWLENTENIYLNSFCFGYRPTVGIDPYYMAYMLRSEAVRKQIIYLAQGISRYNISKNGVMEISVPLPDQSEQMLLGKYFKHLDNLITLHQRKYEKLKQFKQSLLEKMFA